MAQANHLQKAVIVSEIDKLYEFASRIRSEQIVALSQLIKTLEESVDTSEDIDFRSLVRVTQRLLEFDDAKMAKVLNVSRPTVGRWIRGVSTPHRLTRDSICRELATRARDKMKLIRD